MHTDAVNKPLDDTLIRTYQFDLQLGCRLTKELWDDRIENMERHVALTGKHQEILDELNQKGEEYYGEGKQEQKVASN